MEQLYVTKEDIAEISKSVSERVLATLSRHMAVGYEIDVSDWDFYFALSRVKHYNGVGVKELRKIYMDLSGMRTPCYFDADVQCRAANASNDDTYSNLFKIDTSYDSIVVHAAPFFKVKLRVAENYSIYLLYALYADNVSGNYSCEFLGFYVDIDEIYTSVIKKYVLNIELDTNDEDVVFVMGSDSDSICLDEPLHVRFIRWSKKLMCLYSVDKFYV